MWAWSVFFIGFLVGIVILLIIVWLLYINKIFFFEYCSETQPTCKRDNYFRNPSEAIANGYPVDEILTIKNGNMYFTRPPVTNNCTPGNNQTILITFPEFCAFETIDGLFEGTNGGVGDTYIVDINGEKVEVVTSKSCNPISPNTIISGTPILAWT